MKYKVSYLTRIRIYFLKFLIDFNERLIFEKKLRKFYQKNSTCNLVLDVGANHGQTIDFFLRLNSDCEIYAFEPNRSLYEKLIVKYKTKPNVKIYMLGLSDQAGKKIFHENIFDFTSTFEEVNKSSLFLEKKGRVLGIKADELIKDSYEVEVTTLSEFISSNDISNIDVIKIDVEGHEYACLKGLFDSKNEFDIKLIQTEKLNTDMYQTDFSSVEQILKENKFIKCSDIRHGFGDFEDVIFKKQLS